MKGSCDIALPQEKPQAYPGLAASLANRLTVKPMTPIGRHHHRNRETGHAQISDAENGVLRDSFVVPLVLPAPAY